MQRYANHGGDAGVVACEIGADGVVVQFADGARYLYTARSAGAANLARMQALARAGRGLNAFINRHVRERHARKLA